MPLRTLTPKNALAMPSILRSFSTGEVLSTGC
jgi:hypothetical protein